MGTWNQSTPPDDNDMQSQYIGCIGVKTSMKSLCQQVRSEVAKESINRLCDANNFPRSPDKKILEHIEGILDDKPNLLHSGTDVKIRVNETHLNVISIETGDILLQHEMPNVSFASRGDDDTTDFVAYVAKDPQFGRACFVFHCYQSASVVFEAIGHGFQRRSEIFSKNSYLINQNKNSGIFNSPDSRNAFHVSYRCNNENQPGDEVTKATRDALKKEPWFHGSYLTREESENRLKHDGDFLVRESMLDLGNFVLSVMHDGMKLHLLFDSMGKVKTKEMEFTDISHMVKYHHDEVVPIVADKRTVFLRNGVRPPIAAPRQSH